MARDEVNDIGKYQVIGGFISPVSDAYNKVDLAPSVHRIKMAQLATTDSDWILVDAWESAQMEWVRTVLVLGSFRERLDALGYSEVRVKLVAGADLIQTFDKPNLWSDEDLEVILSRFGLIIVERWASDLFEYLFANPLLYRHRKNIIVAKQYISNDISSTKIRLLLRRNRSVKYLLPDSVCNYIKEHALYLQP